MEEERLNQLLRALPRERASSGFTARVLRRLEIEAEGGSASRQQGSRLHRLMLASATVAAVAVSVALLPREHTPLPLNVTLTPPSFKMGAALPPPPLQRLSQLSAESRPVANRPVAELEPAQAHQMVQELRQESSRLERELRSLQRPMTRRASAPPAEVYFGDDNVDVAMTSPRTRSAQIVAPADRDDGEYNNFLD